MGVTRPRALAAASCACAALLTAGALAACGATDETTVPAAGGAQKAVAKVVTTGKDQLDPTAPLPKARPKVVAPVAGEATDAAAAGASSAAVESSDDEMSLPKPTGPATRTKVAQGGASDVHDLKVDKATALSNGVALPPLEAPEQVMDIIRAGNTIARTPYKWGGGHGSFQDNGYDCSGSVSYALYAAGLIGGSATSGQLTQWGKPGKGRWITVYANGGHTFMEVAGIRFDTSGTRVTGSRWQNEFRPTGGFVARHPAGL
jgi:cell wall-associated NlpC family hydrolase